MARNQHTFAKRQREIEKKRKADEKRARRLQRKQGLDSTDQSATDSDSPDDAMPEDDGSGSNAAS